MIKVNVINKKLYLLKLQKIYNWIKTNNEKNMKKSVIICLYNLKKKRENKPFMIHTNVKRIACR